MGVLVWHGGVDVKKLLFVVGVCAAVAAAASTTSFALEEQRGAAPIATPEDPKSEVQSSTGPAKTESGTEIRIPGLGKLGTLPKMDFGLELLYGATEGKPAQEQDTDPRNTQQPDDFSIRGSLKHRF